VDWMNVAQDREHGNETLGSMKDGEFVTDVVAVLLF